MVVPRHPRSISVERPVLVVKVGDQRSRVPIPNLVAHVFHLTFLF